MIKYLFICLLFSCSQNTSSNPDKNESNMTETQEVVNPHVNGDSLKVAYIGNMGVLVEHEEKTILFDGFHKEYKPAYAFPSHETVDQLIDGNYNGFTSIEIDLVTHNHRDHFSAELVNNFLGKNPKSILIASKQIIEAVRRISSNNNQLHQTGYGHNIDQITHDGIDVKSIRCNHANQARHGDIENTAFLVDLNEYSILHVGDTYWDQAKDVFKTLQLVDINLDIAILPYWMLTENKSKQFIDEFIRPKLIIATHIPPAVEPEQKMELENRYSNVVLFTKLNQQVNYSKTADAK